MKCEEEAACEANIRQAACMRFFAPQGQGRHKMRVAVPTVLFNPSDCTLAPTGMHVNALCNLTEPRNRRLQNVKAAARHHSMHQTPSFASPRVTGCKQRPVTTVSRFLDPVVS